MLASISPEVNGRENAVYESGETFVPKVRCDPQSPGIKMRDVTTEAPRDDILSNELETLHF
ncbi:hypothetical protein D623_10011113 [Myotis brandtii]|uniref:Uncharacterized protein n=1 Tax=Myotis brandtii TaxID=109478 RepID=S7P1V8_MYOBR|nr:hypothetical protein D623_10011113 [Myotis brandtii]